MEEKYSFPLERFLMIVSRVALKICFPGKDTQKELFWRFGSADQHLGNSIDLSTTAKIENFESKGATSKNISCTNWRHWINKSASST